MIPPTIDLWIRAQCGELGYMCCLTEAQFHELIELFGHASYAERCRVYKIICACSIAPNGGLEPPLADSHSAEMNCAKQLLDLVCSTSGLATLNAARVGLIAAIAATSGATKLTLTALLGAVNVLLVACEKRQITLGELKGVCLTLAHLAAAKGAFPDALKGMIGPVLDSPAMQAFTVEALKCCALPAVMAADTPTWAPSASGVDA